MERQPVKTVNSMLKRRTTLVIVGWGNFSGPGPHLGNIIGEQVRGPSAALRGECYFI